MMEFHIKYILVKQGKRTKLTFSEPTAWIMGKSKAEEGKAGIQKSDLISALWDQIKEKSTDFKPEVLVCSMIPEDPKFKPSLSNLVT